MLAAERQAMIVELIKENGSVQVDELAKELNVSSMTIRRDLMKLESGNMNGVMEVRSRNKRLLMRQSRPVIRTVKKQLQENV